MRAPAQWLAVAAVVACAACGSRQVRGSRPQAAPPSSVVLGDCADPSRDGVRSDHPDLQRADRDLDGDGTKELVSADRRLCASNGNCHWNLFTRPGKGSCGRYLGTVSATGIEPLRERGDDGFRDLRGWWKLSGGDRYLLQHYRYQAGAYRVVDAMVCRQEGDDRLLCAEDRN
jgi:hypothetical protein